MEPSHPNEDGSSSSQHHPSTPKPNPSPKYRVRTGCLVCRARKVKCDEQRPSCRNCVRLNRSCTYKTPIGWLLPRPFPTDTDPTTIEHRHSQSDPDKLPVEARPWNEDRDYSTTERSGFPRMEPNLSNMEISDFPNIDVPAHPTPQTNTDASESPSSQRVDGSSRPPHQAVSGSPADRHHATSQIIYLTTIMDWKAASEVPATAPFTYFTEIVDCPLISPFDQLNWKRIKRYVVNLGLQDRLVTEPLLAVEAIYRAQVDHLAMTHATSIYGSAINHLESILSDQEVNFDVILVIAFLLCLCAVTLPNEEEPHLAAFSGEFVAKLEIWLLNKHHSPVSLRLCAWLQLLNIATKRPGSPGLFSGPILDLLYEHVKEVPNLSSLDCDTQPERYLFDTIATPIFNFYLNVQRSSNRVADVTHYRRSRTTSSDQEEVTEILAAVKADLRRLWDDRPGPLRLEPASIRQHFSVEIADQIIELSGICMAAVHAEIISIGRILADPPFPSLEARQALDKIRQITEGDWHAYTNGVLNPGYTRPLFVYGLESFGKDESKWVVSQLRRIRHPMSRSNFLASFLEAHGEAQRTHSRRVTMKYFCYQTFRVPLPFM